MIGRVLDSPHLRFFAPSGIPALLSSWVEMIVDKHYCFGVADNALP